MNHADTAFVLLSTALVLMMALPGIGLFYAGITWRHADAATQALLGAAVAAVAWVLVGYPLAFGGGPAGVDLGGASALAPQLPAYGHAAFQLAFAVVTPLLLLGTTLGRLPPGRFAVGVAGWVPAAYAPLAWAFWNPAGYGSRAGALDFAGGLVVHVAAGASALVLALVLPPRPPGEHPAEVHDPTATYLGTGLLATGWVGFNAGSALAADEVAARAVVASVVAGAAGTLAWALVARLTGARWDRPAPLASGLVAGLVAVTPACGWATPPEAAWIGWVAGFVCAIASDALAGRSSLLGGWKIDDRGDVVAVHGVGGAVGALATGLVAPGGSVAVQAVALAAAACWAGGATLLLVVVGSGRAYRLGRAAYDELRALVTR